MALDYEKEQSLADTTSIIEDFVAWFCQIAMMVGYSDTPAASNTDIFVPDCYSKWLEQVKLEAFLDDDVLGPIENIYQDMIDRGQNIIQTVQSGRRPEQMDFQDFQSTYTGFITRIHRLEKESGGDQNNLDIETGLRNFDNAPKDLKREMERLSRQKTPFSLVMSRIDGFNGEEMALQAAAKSIKICMRTFDDAYYCGNGYFLLSLKHADIGGAQAAANRLKQLLYEFSQEDGAVVTMSHCLAEPIVGDEIPELLGNMRGDLESYADEKDTILRFIEVSPLERYMNSGEV